MKTRQLKRALLARQKINPAKYYTPNGKVEEFINMVGSGDVFVSLFSAANGIGKTACGVNIIANIIWDTGNAWFSGEGRPYEINLPLYQDWQYPRHGRIVSDPTTVHDILIPELKKWFPKDRYRTSKQGKNYEYQWKTDNDWQFEVMTYEQAVKEFESATLGFVWFDEPPPYSIFQANVARMRKGGVIFITATPIAEPWMYDHIVCYKGTEKQRAYVIGEVKDNCIEHGIRGILKHSDIRRMLEEYDEDELEARAYGRFKHLSGLIFKNFDKKIHIIKPFHISKEKYVVIEALDPHPRNPDAVLWLAIDEEGRKFVIDELYDTFTTQELAGRIKSKADRFRIIERLADPLAFQQDKHQPNPEEQTLAGKLSDYGIDYSQAPKKRTQSDRRIGDALDYEKKGTQFLVAPELYFFDTCKRTIWEMQHYQWEEWRGKTKERRNPKEKPMKKDEHMIENLGRSLIIEPSFYPMPKQLGSKSAPPQLDPYE